MTERFAVLDHDWPEPHRDLFLERDGMLLAWRLPADCDFRLSIPAIAAPIHRLIYLDYEGPVAGNRGFVSRLDAGSLEWLFFSNERMCVKLSGSRLKVSFQLAKGEGGSWTLSEWESEPCEAGFKE